MAYDQNSIPKDLRPLNTVRTVLEDLRISPATSSGSSGRPIEGYYASPPTDGSPGTMPAVYYPAMVQDSGFVPVAFSNAVTGVTGWVQQVLPTQPQSGVVGAAVINPANGYTTSPNFETRGGCSPSDRTSEASSEDSVSGRKVKFLCSFGGKILPRLSDGALRYVGGKTRIISIRRDAGFGEFVRKMADTYVENVVIKYQLPEEDLDALVSVSCPDDLENMMDEYEKLIERSSDGSSAKLRIFLFSTLELDLGHIGDVQDGGQRYFEAVNGVVDGLSGVGRIMRKESIDSAASCQNSELSGTEGAESLSHGLGEVSPKASAGGISPKGINPAVSFDTAPRIVCVDPHAVSYADSSSFPLTISMVKSVPTTTLGSVPEQEVERSVPLSLPPASPVVSYAPTSAYMQAYVDPHQETLSHANYMHLPAQMGFPTQMLGPMRPVYAQQPIPAGGSPQQFTPAVSMTMSPGFISMRPNVVPAVVQPHHVRVEHYPSESMVPPRVVQLPAEQGYTAYQGQVPATAQGGVYNWPQIPHPEQVAFSEGSLSPQPAMLPEMKIRYEDCHMCQKQLPHAHSDTVTQDRHESPSGTVSDFRSYCSLPVDSQGQPIIRHAVTGTMAEGNMEHLPGGPRSRFVGSEDHESGKTQAEAISLQNVEGKNVYDKPIPQGPMMTSGIQLPYGMFMANTPQSCQANAVQNLVFQPQHQVVPDPTFNWPLNHDFAPAGMHFQARDYVIHESTKEYSAKATAGGLIDDSNSLAFDNLRQIDGRLENLQLSPPEVPYNTEHNKIFLDARKEVAPENRSHQIPVGEVPSRYNFPSTESYQVTENPVYTGVEPTRAAERTLHIKEWKDNLGWSQPKISGDLKDPLLETALDEVAYLPSGNLNQDLSLDHSLSDEGSAEERVRQELQAVAEGVAASVLLATPSQRSGDVAPDNIEMLQKDKSEDINTKFSEKMNLGFPASGIGQLQIIKNIDLEELRELGSGTFGTVYHGKWRGTDVAIKRINDRCFDGKPSEQERMRDDFWNEAIKLADLHHPNVVAFYGIVLDGPDGSIATVTEYMVNGSLRNALQRNERNLDKRKRLLIGMDVAFGMEYLHQKNIVHFDLKSDNLLVNLRDPHRPICKVGDLGLSKVKCQTLISGGVRGTLPWMAPELLNGSSSLVSEKVDVFSFGIVMWELLTGEEPYADLHYGAIIGGIVSNTLRPPVPETCDPNWRALMEKCWSSEPSDRPNFIEIAIELRAMAAKLPSRGQAQNQLPSTNPQAKS